MVNHPNRKKQQQANHTPGPWRCAGHSVVTDEQPDGEMLGTFIAEIEPATAQNRHRFRAPGLSANANARLIAAAPEMLAALKEYVAETERDARESGDDPSAYSAAYVSARAAIAKAEGHTP